MSFLYGMVWFRWPLTEQCPSVSLQLSSLYPRLIRFQEKTNIFNSIWIIICIRLCVWIRVRVKERVGV